MPLIDRPPKGKAGWKLTAVADDVELGSDGKIGVVRGVWTEGHYGLEADLSLIDGALFVSRLLVTTDWGDEHVKPATGPYDRTKVPPVPTVQPLTADFLRTISPREMLRVAREQIQKLPTWEREWAEQAGVEVDPEAERRLRAVVAAVAETEPTRRGRPAKYSDEFDREVAKRYLELAGERGVWATIATEWSEKLGRPITVEVVRKWLSRIGKKQILLFDGRGLAGARPGPNFTPPKPRRTSNKKGK